MAKSGIYSLAPLMGASHGAGESFAELPWKNRSRPFGKALRLPSETPKAKLESTAAPRDGGKPEWVVEIDRYPTNLHAGTDGHSAGRKTYPRCQARDLRPRRLKLQASGVYAKPTRALGFRKNIGSSRCSAGEVR